MIRRERLINKLDELGAVCVSNGSRNDLFRRNHGGTLRYASVPRHDFLTEEYVAEQLLLIGYDPDHIDEFINQNRAC